MDQVVTRFGRVEPRSTVRAFVAALLSPVERKNCWWLAEQAGHGDPQAMQRLLRTAVWDADVVRHDLRAFVAAQLGHPAGVLIPDENGFLKKDTGSVGGAAPIERHRWADRELSGISRVRVWPVHGRLPPEPQRWYG